MVRTRKEYQYVEVWSGKVSERVTARISRMIDPPKERQFWISEEYLQQGQTEEEYKKESQRRLQTKKDDEKYYINAQVIGFDGNPFLSKGFSITRKDIPNMIDGFQKIVGGEFDSQMKRVLVESGIMKDVKEEVEEIQTEEKEEKKGKEEKFQEWYDGLTEPQKKEVGNMQKSGWTKEEIKIAFEFERIKKT